MLDTQAIMHELSTDLEVTFGKVIGSAEIPPSRPGIDPFVDTRPMYVPTVTAHPSTFILFDVTV